MKSSVVLKAGKEKSLLKRHPWIFSGAIEQLPSFENGEILPVLSSSGAFLAQAYFHQENSIAGRILSFQQGPIEEVLHLHLEKAIQTRKALFSSEKTNCYRLINAEADGIPGLIVDCYDRVLVIQINTCGIERLKDQIVEILIKKCKPLAIYEKSLSSARKQEGLCDAEGWIYGKYEEELVLKENGLFFQVSLEKGQKTGFFLDQREMRAAIGKLSYGKKVLNCFSYSAGFSIYALANGAQKVVSIDCNLDALHLEGKIQSLIV